MNQIFKALNDRSRRVILMLLREEDLTAGEIAEHFDMSKPSISHHPDVLKRADLVSSEKRGQYVHYTINTTVLEEVIEWIRSLIN